MLLTWSSVACRNDVFDSDTEVDKNKRESVVNMTGRFVSMHPSFFSFLTTAASIPYSDKAAAQCFDCCERFHIVTDDQVGRLF
jgi:hypothetical protein